MKTPNHIATRMMSVFLSLLMVGISPDFALASPQNGEPDVVSLAEELAFMQQFQRSKEELLEHDAWYKSENEDLYILHLPQAQPRALKFVMIPQKEELSNWNLYVQELRDGTFSYKYNKHPLGYWDHSESRDSKYIAYLTPENMENTLIQQNIEYMPLPDPEIQRAETMFEQPERLVGGMCKEIMADKWEDQDPHGWITNVYNPYSPEELRAIKDMGQGYEALKQTVDQDNVLADKNLRKQAKVQNFKEAHKQALAASVYHTMSFVDYYNGGMTQSQWKSYFYKNPHLDADTLRDPLFRNSVEKIVPLFVQHDQQSKISYAEVQTNLDKIKALHRNIEVNVCGQAKKEYDNSHASASLVMTGTTGPDGRHEDASTRHAVDHNSTVKAARKRLTKKYNEKVLPQIAQTMAANKLQLLFMSEYFRDRIGEFDVDDCLKEGKSGLAQDLTMADVNQAIMDASKSLAVTLNDRIGEITDDHDDVMKTYIQSYPHVVRGVYQNIDGTTDEGWEQLSHACHLIDDMTQEAQNERYLDYGFMGVAVIAGFLTAGASMAVTLSVMGGITAIEAIEAGHDWYRGYLMDDHAKKGFLIGQNTYQGAEDAISYASGIRTQAVMDFAMTMAAYGAADVGGEMYRAHKLAKGAKATPSSSPKTTSVSSSKTIKPNEQEAKIVELNPEDPTEVRVDAPVAAVHVFDDELLVHRELNEVRNKIMEMRERFRVTRGEITDDIRIDNHQALSQLKKILDEHDIPAEIRNVASMGRHEMHEVLVLTPEEIGDHYQQFSLKTGSGEVRIDLLENARDPYFGGATQPHSTRTFLHFDEALALIYKTLSRTKLHEEGHHMFRAMREAGQDSDYHVIFKTQYTDESIKEIEEAAHEILDVPLEKQHLTPELVQDEEYLAEELYLYGKDMHRSTIDFRKSVREAQYLDMSNAQEVRTFIEKHNLIDADQLKKPTLQDLKSELANRYIRSLRIDRNSLEVYVEDVAIRADAMVDVFTENPDRIKASVEMPISDTRQPSVELTVDPSDESIQFAIIPEHLQAQVKKLKSEQISNTEKEGILYNLKQYAINKLNNLSSTGLTGSLDKELSKLQDLLDRVEAGQTDREILDELATQTSTIKKLVNEKHKSYPTASRPGLSEYNKPHAPKQRIFYLTHQNPKMSQETLDLLKQDFADDTKVFLVSDDFPIHDQNLLDQATIVRQSQVGEIRDGLLQGADVHFAGGYCETCLSNSIADIITDFKSSSQLDEMEVTIHADLSYMRGYKNNPLFRGKALDGANLTDEVYSLAELVNLYKKHIDPEITDVELYERFLRESFMSRNKPELGPMFFDAQHVQVTRTDQGRVQMTWEANVDGKNMTINIETNGDDAFRSDMNSSGSSKPDDDTVSYGSHSKGERPSTNADADSFKVVEEVLSRTLQTPHKVLWTDGDKAIVLNHNKRLQEIDLAHQNDATWEVSIGEEEVFIEKGLTNWSVDLRGNLSKNVFLENGQTIHIMDMPFTDPDLLKASTYQKEIIGNDTFVRAGDHVFFQIGQNRFLKGKRTGNEIVFQDDHYEVYMPIEEHDIFRIEEEKWGTASAWRYETSQGVSRDVTDFSIPSNRIEGIPSGYGESNCASHAFACDAYLADGHRSSALPEGLTGNVKDAPDDHALLPTLTPKRAARHYDAHIEHMDTPFEVDARLVNMEEGGTALIFIKKSDGDGHVLNAFKNNGRIEYYDWQTGRVATDANTIMKPYDSESIRIVETTQHHNRVRQGLEKNLTDSVEINKVYQDRFVRVFGKMFDLVPNDIRMFLNDSQNFYMEEFVKRLEGSPYQDRIIKHFQNEGRGNSVVRTEINELSLYQIAHFVHRTVDLPQNQVDEFFKAVLDDVNNIKKYNYEGEVVQGIFTNLISDMPRLPYGEKVIRNIIGKRYIDDPSLIQFFPFNSSTFTMEIQDNLLHKSVIGHFMEYDGVNITHVVDEFDNIGRAQERNVYSEPEVYTANYQEIKRHPHDDSIVFVATNSRTGDTRVIRIDRNMEGEDVIVHWVDPEVGFSTRLPEEFMKDVRAGDIHLNNLDETQVSQLQTWVLANTARNSKRFYVPHLVGPEQVNAWKRDLELGKTVGFDDLELIKAYGHRSGITTLDENQVVMVIDTEHYGKTGKDSWIEPDANYVLSHRGGMTLERIEEIDGVTHVYMKPKSIDEVDKAADDDLISTGGRNKHPDNQYDMFGSSKGPSDESAKSDASEDATYQPTRRAFDFDDETPLFENPYAKTLSYTPTTRVHLQRSMNEGLSGTNLYNTDRYPFIEQIKAEADIRDYLGLDAMAGLRAELRKAPSQTPRRYRDGRGADMGTSQADQIQREINEANLHLRWHDQVMMKYYASESFETIRSLYRAMSSLPRNMRHTFSQLMRWNNPKKIKRLVTSFRMTQSRMLAKTFDGVSLKTMLDQDPVTLSLLKNHAKLEPRNIASAAFKDRKHLYAVDLHVQGNTKSLGALKEQSQIVISPDLQLAVKDEVWVRAYPTQSQNGYTEILDQPLVARMLPDGQGGYSFGGLVTSDNKSQMAFMKSQYGLDTSQFKGKEKLANINTGKNDSAKDKLKRMFARFQDSAMSVQKRWFVNATDIKATTLSQLNQMYKNKRVGELSMGGYQMVKNVFESASSTTQNTSHAWIAMDTHNTTLVIEASDALPVSGKKAILDHRAYHVHQIKEVLDEQTGEVHFFVYIY